MIYKNPTCKIIDCTLRDGGYYNNWNFSKKLINKYLISFSRTEINNIEIGFLTIPPDPKMGITANCDGKFFKTIKIPNNINIGIMINASDFLTDKLSDKEIFKTLNNIPKSKVKFIRIACHFKHLFKIKKYFKFLKKAGFKMFLNIMQISDIPNNDIKKVCKDYAKLTDVIYFADSFGSLNPNKFKKIINKFKKNSTLDFGIHAHDNMKNALKNTIMASENDVRWLDSTIMGMGRGPGNTKTEELAKHIYGSKSKNSKLLNKILFDFKLLKRIYNWGTNKYYYLSGLYKIHPTYIQMLISDNRYKNFDYTEVIKNLKKLNARKYNPNTMHLAMNFYKNQSIKLNSNLSKIEFKKDIIIFGNGKSLENKDSINKKLLNVSTKILVNNTKNISKKIIDLIVYCHPLRLITDINLLKKSKSHLLIPMYSIPKVMQKKIINKNLINFNLKLGKKIVLNKNFITMPKPITLVYLLGYLISIGIKKVYIAGFDDYESDNPYKDDTQSYIDNLKKIVSDFEIISLTKTRLKL